MKKEKNLVPQSLSALVPSREKTAFTLAEGATQVAPSKACRRGAFTLAEVLITLAVVGVVAILVMPKLLDNVAERKYDAARKKALATIGEALRQSSIQGELSSASDIEDYVTNYLSKRLKIVQICKNTELEKCGLITEEKAITTALKAQYDYQLPKKTTMPTKLSELMYPASKDTITDYNSESVGLLLPDGFAVNLFINTNCLDFHSATSKFNAWAGEVFYQGAVCANAIYDMNGLAKPNEAGKDIGFVTLLYSDTQAKAYAPNPYVVKSSDGDCSALGNDYSMISFEEFLSLYYNQRLSGFIARTGVAASFLSTPNRFFICYGDKGGAYGGSCAVSTTKSGTHCIKR